MQELGIGHLYVGSAMVARRELEVSCVTSRNDFILQNHFVKKLCPYFYNMHTKIIKKYKSGASSTSWPFKYPAPLFSSSYFGALPFCNTVKLHCFYACEP
jgi:hypothetical protein